MKDLKNILEKIAPDSKLNFFGLGDKLKKAKIEASYYDHRFLIIYYNDKKYCLTSNQNAEKSNGDITIFNDFILGLN